MAIGYTITVLRIEHTKDALFESGINTVKDLADQIRIELLENDLQAIRSHLVNTRTRKDTVYLAVSDHRDEIIAVESDEKSKPVRIGSVQQAEQITFWEGKFPSQEKIFGLTANIQFADTKIGEIHLALSADETEVIRNQFMGLVILSLMFLVLSILFLGLRKNNVRLWSPAAFFRRRRQTAHNPENFMVICPICGTKKSVDPGGPDPAFSYLKSNAKISNPGQHNNPQADMMRIDLTEIARREDLSWIKRQVILRCSEIIKKLTT